MNTLLSRLVGIAILFAGINKEDNVTATVLLLAAFGLLVAGFSSVVSAALMNLFMGLAGIIAGFAILLNSDELSDYFDVSEGRFLLTTGAVMLVVSILAMLRVVDHTPEHYKGIGADA